MQESIGYGLLVIGKAHFLGENVLFLIKTLWFVNGIFADVIIYIVQ